jgi:hypothetical protein
MSDEDVWQPLRQEIECRQIEGKMIRLWLRDDDATRPVAALDRLIDLTGSFSIPVAIAAIPERSGEALAQCLSNGSHATPVVHGWNHQNHAPTLQKKQELGDHRGLDEILGDLSTAIGRMTELFGDRLVPMLVPPWNRIGSGALPHLERLGYRALSCFGIDRPQASVPVFNTHVDLIDWHGTRGCRDHASLVGDLLLHTRRMERPGEVVGILTHHLDHDSAAWAFLETLFALTRSFSCCHWVSARGLIMEGEDIAHAD